MPVELFTYTGTQLSNEVKRQFGDTGNVQITDDHILNWINNGQRSISATNPFLEKVFTTNLLAGQATYDLNALMAGERVMSYSSVRADGRKLKFVPWQKYNEQDMPDTSTSTDGAEIFTEYASVLTLSPPPSESIVNGLVVYYLAWPADLTAIGNNLTIPDRFYNALSAYVFARALELDENFEAASGQLEQHSAALAVEAGRDTMSPTDFYPTISYVEP